MVNNEQTQWENSLARNATDMEKMSRAGASVRELAYEKYQDIDPLLRLGRVAEARDAALWCWESLAGHPGCPYAMIFKALAAIESEEGHEAEAKELQEWALTFSYLNFNNIRAYVREGSPLVAQRDLRNAAASAAFIHLDLAITLVVDPHLHADIGLAHALAAAMISQETGDQRDSFMATLSRILATPEVAIHQALVAICWALRGRSILGWTVNAAAYRCPLPPGQRLVRSWVPGWRR